VSEIVRPTLRKALADSHIAAVTIVVLLIWSVDSGVRAIAPPILSVFGFLVTMVAIRDIPYGFGIFSSGSWLSQVPAFTHFLDAVVRLTAAWVLSRWVYKVGPCRSLIECRERFARGNHA
jgi:hypothetical protein